jgi:threonine/homoserine/homoserine lactone efflux protein
MVFFTLAVTLCVLGLVAISLWWSWLFIAAILESVRSDQKSKKPERERTCNEMAIQMAVSGL